MRDIVICRECKHRVPPRCPNERSYCDKHKVYLYEDNNEGYCIHGERGTRMKKQIKWALDVLNGGAWWDNIPDDASDAEIQPLCDAIDKVQETLERLTYCGECKYFKQTISTFGDCERCNNRKFVLDFCSDGKVREEEKR